MSPSASRALVVVVVVAVLAAGSLAVVGLAGAGPLGLLGRFVPFGGSPDGGAGDRPGAATVVRVVDGDTLVVDVGGREEPVRLIGIDTPETVAPGRPVECFGPEASERLGALAPAGTPVRLERDVEARDTYDRLLAYVYRAADGLFVNRAQVESGSATAAHHPPNSAHRAELSRVQAAARAAGVGLWSACGGPSP